MNETGTAPSTTAPEASIDALFAIVAATDTPVTVEAPENPRHDAKSDPTVTVRRV